MSDDDTVISQQCIPAGPFLPSPAFTAWLATLAPPRKKSAPPAAPWWGTSFANRRWFLVVVGRRA